MRIFNGNCGRCYPENQKNHAKVIVVIDMMKLILSIMLILLIPILVGGEETRTIVAAGDSWPPFVDPHHPKEGLSLEIIRAAFQTQGYEVRYKIVPWARAEAAVKSGEYDILPDVWFTESRKKDLIFSVPYAKNIIRFITLKDDPFEYDSINSLQGKTVGTIRGYTYSEEFSTATLFTKEEVTDFLQNMKKLLAKRIDLTLEDEIVAKYRIALNDSTWFTHIRFSQKPLSVQSLFIAAGYKNPRHIEIIEAFNRGLEMIKVNGHLADIANSYGVGEFYESPDHIN